MANIIIAGADEVAMIDGVQKVINKDVEVVLGANGATPRLYRMYFKKDLLQTIVQLQQIYDEKPDNWDDMSEEQRKKYQNDQLLMYFDYNLIDELAYVCAKTANPNIGDYLEWLAQFAPFALMDKGEDIFNLLFRSTVTKIDSNGDLGKYQK
ncbi:MULTISPECIES: hypothetical protein [unclassified Breznakia]|uniref:hypothetical protein n=1 Tax=unclassified Breznakia TaxID=2623764 RepID=UPI0024734D4F|nr:MULTISPECIES: hypothetical protein [unclassified Breznakia]MDH6367132.1 hypothetical protein [Breznakia sp. PH1-1]MDH6404281.1 hypothetical protein [Breznakia sp. PF1-11]MDH6412020.1 hypothetical protein [Breznakia sp. PFB1-11]MDH6414269.1 hypothetical protein [Breznakia sp. PFB1-14]MDH6416634.1 hypothetical protein [Breznakia sp. PFB1-4]